METPAPSPAFELVTLESGGSTSATPSLESRRRVEAAVRRRRRGLWLVLLLFVVVVALAFGLLLGYFLPKYARRRATSDTIQVRFRVTLSLPPLLAASPLCLSDCCMVEVSTFLPLVLQLTSGKIQGMKSNTTYTFLGVPYAAPPVGSLRWRPPIPVTVRILDPSAVPLLHSLTPPRSRGVTLKAPPNSARRAYRARPLTPAACGYAPVSIRCACAQGPCLPWGAIVGRGVIIDGLVCARAHGAALQSCG